MIRRKIWATATCCLAVAGAARAQTGSTQPANPALLGAQIPGYSSRGPAMNPGYPRFIPRNYSPPTPTSYGTKPADLGAVTSGVVAAPAETFATDSGGVPTITEAPAGPIGMPASSMAGGTLIPMPKPVATGTPMGPAPVIDATVQAPGAIPPGGVYGGPAMEGQVMEGQMIGGPIMGGSMMGDGMMGGPMMNGPALNGGPILDAPCVGGMCGSVDGAQPCVWATGEYLNWRLRSVSVPPLVTTAPAGAPGTLLDPSSTVLFGGSNILENWQSGFRFRAGMWFPDGTSGIDVAFFHIDVTSEHHSFGSDGAQGLFQPFFNTAIGTEDARLVAFTDPVAGPLLAGTVSTVTQSMLWGAEANYRCGWGMGLGGRLDALIGYRYLQLHDRLTIDSRSTTLVPVGPAPAGTLITSTDRFDTIDQFHGAQVGFAGEWQIGLMSFGLRGTVAGGWTQQTVDISGATSARTPIGAITTVPGGLFAQTTNIGNHTRSQFSIVPEIGATLGYQVTNNIRIFGGYNLLYWTNVVRAGEQINRSINGTYIADPVTGTSAPSGAPAPWFQHREESFYVHGYSAGVEFRW